MDRFEKQKRKFEEKKKLLNRGSQRAVEISIEGRKMALWSQHGHLCVMHNEVTYEWESFWRWMECFGFWHEQNPRQSLYSARFTVATWENFLFSFNIFLTTFRWVLFEPANQNTETVEGGDHSLSWQFHKSQQVFSDWPFKTGEVVKKMTK